MGSAWKKNYRIYLGALLIASCALYLKYKVFPEKAAHSTAEIAFEFVHPRSFDVDVRALGELEAAKSIMIASGIKGDQGKIIDMAKDGVQVNVGEFLVRLDSSPFEEKIHEIKTKMKEQEACISACEQVIQSEASQLQHEIKIAEFDLETAELEWNKVVYGDGPMELSKLDAALHKTKVKYEEIEGYSKDLIDLESRGYINSTELKQAQKKLNEEKEVYQAAKLQHESYVNHIQPMQSKKADAALKRAQLRLEDTMKNGGFRIGKAQATLEQTLQQYEDLKIQLDIAKRDLAMCEICAQSPGMVVLREDYRGGQRRKPRVGDNVLKNQTILDLPDLSSMVVKTKVREIDLYKIAIGKPATIEVDAYPNLQFNGKVSWIGVLAQAEPGRSAEDKYFEVKIEFDKVDERLRPGMTARTVIHANSVNNELALPIHAIFDENKKSYCYVERFWGYEKRPLDLGVGNEHWIEVKSGLKSGEKVCLTTPEAIIR